MSPCSQLTSLTDVIVGALAAENLLDVLGRDGQPGACHSGEVYSPCPLALLWPRPAQTCVVPPATCPEQTRHRDVSCVCVFFFSSPSSIGKTKKNEVPEGPGDGIVGPLMVNTECPPGSDSPFSPSSGMAEVSVPSTFAFLTRFTWKVI